MARESVVLKPLTADHAAAACRWFDNDEEGQRRLDVSFYGVHPKWWQLVDQDAARYGWLGVMGSDAVGFVDLEVHDGRGSFTIYVRRELRQRGIGKTLVKLLAQEARAMGVEELVGHVEPGYVASSRLVLASGFSRVGEDDFGPIFSLGLVDA
jgi:GNAT superfamily N-acetyltransferase